MKEIVTYNPIAVEAEGMSYVEEAKIVEAEVSEVVISSPEAYAATCELARMLKTRWQEIEDVRTSITGPMVNAKRNADAFFKPALDRYAAAETRCKIAIGRYVEAQEKAKKNAMLALSAGAPLETLEVPTRPEASGVTTRKVRKWRIVDEDRIARHFCSPDPKKIDAYLKDGGLEAIPGIEFFDDFETRVTRAKAT
jgi:hypothetical protein